MILFLELNLNVYFQYFQYGINFEDFSTYWRTRTQ
jgi:hypothetical protein